MSETSPEPSDPKGGFSRAIGIALVLVGALWVTLFLREDPAPAPNSASAVETGKTDTGMAPVAQISPDLDATQPLDVRQKEDTAPPPQESGPDPEELKRRTAMANRRASLNRDPVEVLVNDAQRLLDEGRNDEAIERARQSMRERKSPQAYAIETRAYCAKGDGEKARRAFKRVLGSQREPTLLACKERGISLLEP